MNYYQHHIGDFIRDTARMSDCQCMAYLRMIWHYYDTEQPLECDIDVIAFSIGANAKDVELILKHYFFQHEGRWHHARCDKEILTFRSKSQKAKDNANARWNNASAMRPHSERIADAHKNDANQEPITNNQEPGTNNQEPGKNTYSPEFDHAWSLYPSRPGANKKRTFSAWNARLNAGATVEQMTAGVERFAVYCKDCNTEPNYIKQAYTFFGPDEHYLSDWTPVQRQSATISSKQAARNNYSAEAAAAREKQGKESHERDITGECTVIY